MTSPIFLAYPGIVQFRDAIKTVQRHTSHYAGQADNGEPMYTFDASATKTMRGTVKLHGRNVAVAIHVGQKGSLWCQSRNHVLSAQSDMLGFHTFVFDRQRPLGAMCDQVIEANPTATRAYIFGEWVGPGVQRGVAISKIDRSFFVFAACVVDDKDNVVWQSEEVVRTLKAPSERIYNIFDYEKWTLEIDFGSPQKVQAELERITDKVEKCCPVAAAFGHNGIGEGVVWSTLNEDGSVLNFKVKGKEHAVVASKKGAAATDDEKLASVKEFVDYAVTPNRLEQGVDQLFTSVGKAPATSDTPQFVKWVIDDVIKEEADRMTENNLVEADVKKAVSNAARLFFIQRCKPMWSNSTV